MFIYIQIISKYNSFVTFIDIHVKERSIGQSCMLETVPVLKSLPVLRHEYAISNWVTSNYATEYICLKEGSFDLHTVFWSV